MKISSFWYKEWDAQRERWWELEEVQFDALTLLVGASGVGKTLQCTVRRSRNNACLQRF